MSIYQAFCVCGHKTATRSKEFVCEKCGRHGAINWDNENNKAKESAKGKK